MLKRIRLFGGLSTKRHLAIGCALFVALGTLLNATAGARAADITVCNEFRHPVFFAFAWEEGGEWVSRGWSEVKTGACNRNPLQLDKVDVPGFYYHAETNWVPTGGGNKTMYTWGKGGEFAVHDKPFHFRDADKKRRGTRHAAFTQTLKRSGGTLILTITVQNDGKNVSQTVKPSAPASKDEQKK